MIIIATHCYTADQITVIHWRLLSNNTTYCRLLSPRVAPRSIKLLSFTVDCCRKMRLTADYCRHALLHGRSNYCHSLSIVVEKCDLLPIIVATRYSTATPKCRSLSIFVDYYRHARFSSVRSVFRGNKTLDSSVWLLPSALSVLHSKVNSISCKPVSMILRADRERESEMVREGVGREGWEGRVSPDSWRDLVIFSKYNQQDATFLKSIYFCKTPYMFQTGFRSIIRSSKLHIQRQAFVRL